MGIAAWFFGTLGGLCALMGILRASEVTPLLGAEFTAMFWLTLGVLLLLGCIAASISRGTYE